mmetsp:Transcript_82836/g.234713  ORF Transcript_82836/g.234713 Transcript_82836/m.234713 type:complete len:84 (-) Transcript_82836:202-453(-)
MACTSSRMHGVRLFSPPRPWSWQWKAASRKRGCFGFQRRPEMARCRGVMLQDRFLVASAKPGAPEALRRTGRVSVTGGARAQR